MNNKTRNDYGKDDDSRLNRLFGKTYSEFLLTFKEEDYVILRMKYNRLSIRENNEYFPRYCYISVCNKLNVAQAEQELKEAWENLARKQNQSFFSWLFN